MEQLECRIFSARQESKGYRTRLLRTKSEWLSQVLAKFVWSTTDYDFCEVFFKPPKVQTTLQHELNYPVILSRSCYYKDEYVLTSNAAHTAD